MFQLLYIISFYFHVENDETVENDSEIQAFRDELTLERKIDGSGGCGMKV